jgi:hypothetical protein
MALRQPAIAAEKGIAADEPVAMAGGWAERLARALRSRERVVIGVVVAGYIGVAAVHSALVPITFDEWFTYEVARLPSLGRTIGALGEGPEQSPPLHFLLARASMALAGADARGLRAPANEAGINRPGRIDPWEVRRIPVDHSVGLPLFRARTISDQVLDRRIVSVGRDEGDLVVRPRPIAAGPAGDRGRGVAVLGRPPDGHPTGRPVSGVRV